MPDELICQVFDDSALDILLDRGIGFSTSTDAELRRLSRLADAVDLDVAPAHFVTSAAWIAFVQGAVHVLALVEEDLAR